MVPQNFKFGSPSVLPMLPTFVMSDLMTKSLKPLQSDLNCDRCCPVLGRQAIINEPRLIKDIVWFQWTVRFDYFAILPNALCDLTTLP